MTLEAHPDPTAARVALWRAMHVQLDPPPHVLADEVGYRLLAPDESWRQRPDMHPEGTKPFRAWVVARARLIEEVVEEQAARGVKQYVLLGAGLDSFAQRRPELASKLRVFEVDQARPVAWKRARLEQLGYGVPAWLRLVPTDFESPGGWRASLAAAGFDDQAPAVLTSTGVSMYLTREANLATLKQIAALAPGSTLVMTFQLPTELVDAQDRPGRELALKGARASGTPFISFFTPEEMIALAREAGFRQARHVPGSELHRRWFAGRADGLRPSSGEDLLVAAT